MHTEEIHPFQYYIPEGSTRLLIGTFPPSRRNWSYDFFYPNKRNAFWKLIAAIAGTDLLHVAGAAAVEERKNLLQQIKLGVTDMGAVILRNEQGSLDEDLTPLIFTDIVALLHEHVAINTLLFTSSSGQSSAAGWFVQYLQSKQIAHRFPSGKKPLYSSIFLAGRNIRLVVLFSPSGRAANRIAFDDLVAMYQQALLPG